MGLEFIEGKRKTYERSWNGGVAALKTPELFAVSFEKSCRLVTLALIPGSRLAVDDELVLELVEARLVASRGAEWVGYVEQVPEGILAELELAAGVCSARVSRLGAFGESADIELC